jgi:hypothetical protein
MRRMLVTLPVTVVARVTAAVIAWPPPFSVIEVALTAVTWPPISKCSVAPLGSDGTPPPSGESCVPLPDPLDGVLAPGVALAAAGLAVAWCMATSTTPNPKAAATTAVSASSQPRLGPLRPPGRPLPGG